jgi:hypothetical protein
MVVKLHALTEHTPEVRPARAKRQWMDDFPDRHAYRCLPLSIANAFGWEVLCPIPVEIRWNGGMAVEDIQVIGLAELPGERRWTTSAGPISLVESSPSTSIM